MIMTPLPPFVLFFSLSNLIIVVASIVSFPVVFVADMIIDDGVYYLLHASTHRLLILIL